MKRGHVVGTRKVSRQAQAWYDAIAEEHIKKIEAAWKEKQHQATQPKYPPRRASQSPQMSWRHASPMTVPSAREDMICTPYQKRSTPSILTRR